MLLKFWIKSLLKAPLYSKLKNSYQNLPARQKNVIFIHIPKAAGTSIHKSFFGRLSGFGHATGERYLSIYGPLDFFSTFRFTFVRNPYDRFVSSYEYLKEGGNNSNDLLFYEKHIKPYQNFDDFVLNGFLKKTEIQNYIHFKKQVSFIYSGSRCLVDFIGRFENLEKDYKYLSSIIGVEAELQFVNKTSDRRSFEEYFNTSEVKEAISSFYQDDFMQLGYKSVST